MPQAQSFYERPFYEGLTWWFTRERIGHGLRARYQVPKELPPKLLALLVGLDATEGNYSLRYSGTTPDRSADDFLFPSHSWQKDDLLGS